MSHSLGSTRTREFVVFIALVLLFGFWILPVSALAGLLSYEEIVKTWPKLGELIGANDRIRAIVQNSLPSVALITLNACLPFMLEGEFLGLPSCFRLLNGRVRFLALTYVQGLPARSWIEYSLMKK